MDLHACVGYHAFLKSATIVFPTLSEAEFFIMQEEKSSYASLDLEPYFQDVLGLQMRFQHLIKERYTLCVYTKKKSPEDKLIYEKGNTAYTKHNTFIGNFVLLQITQNKEYFFPQRNKNMYLIIDFTECNWSSAVWNCWILHFQ